MNNYELIKSMNMEQLAYFLCSFDNHVIKRVNNIFGKEIVRKEHELDLIRRYYRYLKQEVEE